LDFPPQIYLGLLLVTSDATMAAEFASHGWTAFAPAVSDVEDEENGLVAGFFLSQITLLSAN